jgi:polar amino acid transport system substrate-binding protein
MLYSRRGAVLVAAAAYGLFVSVVLLENHGWLAHHRPAGMRLVPEHAPHFELAVCLGLFATLAGGVVITTWIMEGRRARERQLVETQQALLRNQHELEAAYESLRQKQKQLVQTEKQASLGRLVAGIAHEINNPIQFIHGNMNILSEAFQDLLPMLEEYSKAEPNLRIARLDPAFFRRQVPLLLKDMSDGAERIRAIVRDLRTFARKDEGRADEVVDLGEVLGASVRLLHNELKRHKVDLDVDPALPRLRGNLTQLQQVCVNVLQNACQAMREGVPGVIRVRARADDDGAHVRLEVEDNGCGMPPEVVAHIFDPFFTTRQRTGGTGLGLAITEGIIQQHGGRIDVESRVGAGTVFRFVLPTRGGLAA